MAFASRKQPFKAIYIICSITYILCRLPIWTVIGLFPSTRPRPSWTLKRTLIVKSLRAILWTMFNTSIVKPNPPQTYIATARQTGFVWVDATPDFVLGDLRSLAELNGVEAERTCGFWYGSRGVGGAVGQRASKGEKVVYHMHGGGYIMGTAHTSNTALKTLFPGFFEHFGADIRIFALEYRKSSAPPFELSSPFPAALLDTIAGYRGDSAGGTFAFELALYLSTYQFPKLPVAGGLLLLSPGTDIAQTHVGPHSSPQRNNSSDYLQPFIATGYPRKALLGKITDDMAAASMWISPGSARLKKDPGAFSRLPKTCIVAGDAELSLDAIRTLRRRIQEDTSGDHVRYIEMMDATHDFLTMSWHEPERTHALREIGHWVHGIWES
ncbi:hypothetical protein CERSUDRAFT_106757 [Gelatoporia subvermispora B]|uniref:Alpha/beta hydrolase fold-3 domain-containing protein n=1 Tax=Ceriporiopsis subvermispora (strain B) TaxID=914234 RepID=M2RA98_CERS8|nr:hypothetical protein CERSUDRAFT_106757 [Gelatoporia subvermispora B]